MLVEHAKHTVLWNLEEYLLNIKGGLRKIKNLWRDVDGYRGLTRTQDNGLAKCIAKLWTESIRWMTVYRLFIVNL